MTTGEAAKLKGVGRQAILDAIREGRLNAVKFGRDWNVLDDEKFRAYVPALTAKERIARRWAKERATQPILAARESKGRYGAKSSKAKRKER